jgi:hypothetical protein
MRRDDLPRVKRTPVNGSLVVEVVKVKKNFASFKSAFLSKQDAGEGRPGFRLFGASTYPRYLYFSVFYNNPRTLQFKENRVRIGCGSKKNSGILSHCAL